MFDDSTPLMPRIPLAVTRALQLDPDAPEALVLKAIRGQQDAIHELTHQVLCCGVAASHPDPLLTTTGAYASKWNSAQAEKVRELRRDRDRLQAELDKLRAHPIAPAPQT